MSPDPPSWWIELYHRRRELLEKKFSKGEFYAIDQEEDDELRFLTDNLQDMVEGCGGYFPPFIIEDTDA